MSAAICVRKSTDKSRCGGRSEVGREANRARAGVRVIERVGWWTTLTSTLMTGSPAPSLRIGGVLSDCSTR